VHSPSLDRGIGMGWVEATLAKPGTALDIMVRGKAVRAEVVRPPFYKQGSIRR
jgi:aminomethyltransferase